MDIDFKEKYLKYKEKYLKLKEQYGGVIKEERCSIKNIFDLDCFMPITEDLKEDYIFTKRISKETLDILRIDILNYYSNIFTFLIYPELSYEEILEKKTDSIDIPIIEYISVDKNRIGKVNYDLIATKMLKNNVFNKIKEYYLEKKRLETEIQKIESDLNINKNNKKVIIKNGDYYEFGELNKLIEEIKTFLRTGTNTGIEFLKFSDPDINSLNEFKKIFGNIVVKINDVFNNIYKNANFIKLNVSEQNKIVNFNNKYIELYNKLDKLKNNFAIIINDNTKFENLENKLNNRKIDLYNIKIILPNNISNNLINYENVTDSDLLEAVKSTDNEKTFMMKLIDNKKKEIINNIKNNFDKNKNLNYQIVNISLKWFDESLDNLKTISNGHANSVIVIRSKKNGIDNYLCIRTEPHRRSNIYCRNSVRKAIRDIFSMLPNSYYLDYVINSRIGLQSDEKYESENIEKSNLNDFDKIPDEIKIYSPLQGNSGFCSSWTLYIALIFMLNTDKSLETIGEYLASYYIKLDLPKKVKDYVTELDTCYGLTPSKKECDKKEDIVADFKDYISYNGNKYTYPDEEDILQNDPKYILVKHIKLYRMIVYMLYIITRKLKKKEIYDSIKNDKDKKILNEIFDRFDSIGKDMIKEKLIKRSKIEFKFDGNIINKDTHLCDDNLFDHKDFCQEIDVIKPIPVNNKWNCENNKLRENNNIRLRGLKSSKIEEKEKFDKLSKDINYVFENYIYK